MKFKNIFLSALIAVSLLRAGPVMAQYYNGEEEEVRQILLDKEVRSLEMGQWYDNLDATVIIFGSKSLVDFQITVRNTGNQVLRNIKVEDRLPSYMNYVYGPGDYDASTKTVTWTIDEINPGVDRVFGLRARVQENDLPGGVSQLCNEVRGEADSGDADGDSACYYIGAEAITIPDTGTPELLMGSVVLAGLGGVAWFLRKIGRGGL